MSQDFLLYGLLVATVAAPFRVYLMLKKEVDKYRAELERQKALMGKVFVENIMFGENFKDESIFKQNVLTVAKQFFRLLKRKYNLKATNYIELIDEIKNMDISPEIKDKIIEFFDTIILLEYSKHDLSPKRKRELKEMVVEIVKRMGEPPVKPE